MKSNYHLNLYCQLFISYKIFGCRIHSNHWFSDAEMHLCFVISFCYQVKYVTERSKDSLNLILLNKNNSQAWEI